MLALSPSRIAPGPTPRPCIAGEELAGRLSSRLGVASAPEAEAETAAEGDKAAALAALAARDDLTAQQRHQAQRDIVKGRIEVEFRTPSPGLQVRSVSSDDPALEVSAETGPILVYP